jgi:hypothetical protein
MPLLGESRKRRRDRLRREDGQKGAGGER